MLYDTEIRHLITFSKTDLEDEGSRTIEGARAKEILTFTQEFCKRNALKYQNKYIFKKSDKRYPWQFWHEVIATHLGEMLGLNIQNCYPALSNDDKCFSTCENCKADKTNHSYGVLIEIFSDANKHLMRAGDFLKELIPNYDYGKGRTHNLQDNIECISAMYDVMSERANKVILANKGVPIDIKPQLNEFALAFMNMVVFDSIIGNTDRHHDNWGIVIPLRMTTDLFFELSPIYDNGTSLGCEIIEKNIDRKLRGSKLLAYIKKGCHHMKDNPNSKGYGTVVAKGIAHMDIADVFGKDLKLSILPVAQKSKDAILSRLSETMKHYQTTQPLGCSCRLTDKRIEFILALLAKRIDVLAEKMNNVSTN